MEIITVQNLTKVFTYAAKEKGLKGSLRDLFARKTLQKTAVENDQDLIVEGAYIPCDWKRYFNKKYLESIRAYFIVMSANYIERHWADIVGHACEIEHRRSDEFSPYVAISENIENLAQCKKYGCNIIYIDGAYRVPLPEIK